MTNENTQQLQELYDKVAVHLIIQGVQSIKDDCCVYRGDGGLMCAVGCLISDENYSIGLEGKIIFVDAVVTAVELSLGQKLELNSLGMLKRLQTIHDSFPTEEWEHRFRSIATDYNLDTTKLDLAVANKVTK